MKRVPILSMLLGMLLLPAALPVQAQELGETSFSNSGAEAAQAPFLRGLLLLHSFEYEDAREAFQEAQAIDPDFAMAYWGEAMSHNHPVWMQQDQDAAQAALTKLGATLTERLAKAPTDREKDYLRTAGVLFFGEGPKEERDDAYAEAMRRLHETYPDDLDAAALYALALLGTSHEGRDFRTYMKAAAVAEEVFAKNPRHPGAAHYLIHSYDDPIHAPLGLRAARVYAEIAPAASHALHMPSHIFVALGMWDDVVAMNEASWAAADARAERKGLGVDQRNFHAFWWLAYGYLQQGRYDDARRTLATMENDADRSGSRRTRFHLTMMRAAYLVDTERWDSPAAAITIGTGDMGLETVATDLFVTGLAALRTGDRIGAEAALDALTDRRAEATEPQEAATVLEHELRALLLLDAGKPDEALRHLDEAIAREDAMRFDFGPPSPVKPSHELYGEALLALDRPADAQAQFRAALDRAPRRARSLLGLARAASQTGDAATAAWAYGELRAVWHQADTDVAELQEVHGALGAVQE